MKTSELIAKLQKIEGDPIVCLYNVDVDENCELVGCMPVEQDGPYLLDEDGKTVCKTGHIIVMRY